MKPHGFKPDIITPDQYVFGSLQLSGEVLQKDGQWDNYLPKDEIQKKWGVETMSCVSFGTLNAIEIIFNRKFNEVYNFSDRFLAVVSETTKTGNSPHKVAEALRKRGTISEDLLPFSEDIDTWEEYHSGVTDELLRLAEEFLEIYKFGHDWVFTGGTIKQKQTLLKYALQYSPIGVSVDAWKKKGGYYVKEKGSIDNHWCTVYGYKEPEN